MATATLKFPRSLTAHGKQFFRDKPEPVADEIGRALANDPRFEVKGLPGDNRADAAYMASAREAGGRPYVKAVRMQSIRDANDLLDPEIEDNYEANGLPAIPALAKLMGWTPTETDIRDALRPGADRTQLDGAPVSPLTSKAVQGMMRKRAVEAAPAVEKPLTVALSDVTGRFIEDPDHVEPAADETGDESGDNPQIENVNPEEPEVDGADDGADEGLQSASPGVASEPKKVKMRTIVLNDPRKKVAPGVDPTTEGAVKLPLGGKS